MADKLDLVVIGTGSAASTVAGRCRAAGWSVAIVDARPFGGTCALRGCDPKKVLVGAADALDRVRRLEGRGLHPAGEGIEWPALMAFKRTFTDPVPRAREEHFARAGMLALHGRARFVGKTAVRVDDREIEARHVVIATGARPADLGFPGAEHVITSDAFLELPDLPRRVAFVGGGYVSFEFAHVSARAGAQVAILHRGARPLERFDPDLVDRLVQHTRRIGIDVRLGAPVQAVERVRSAFVVRTPEGPVEADLVVHGAGRVPDLDDLGLEVAGVARGPGGVGVNDFLQSVSNPAVYAAGDAAASGGLPLTPVAGYQGRIVAANLLEGNHERPDYTGVPSVVFTDPPLAAVGLGEGEARQRGLRVSVKHQDTSRWYSSRRVAEDCSAFKTVVDDDSGQILGAHLVGPHADEVVNLFALAMRRRLRVSDLKEAIFAYPTGASDVAYML